VATAGQKKGIFGRVRAKTGQQRHKRRASRSLSAKSPEPMRRVSAGPNDGMSQSDCATRFRKRPEPDDNIAEMLETLITNS
jgi:hypothetical protein